LQREESAEEEFRDTAVPPAVVPAELARGRWARTAVSLVEFPDFFVLWAETGPGFCPPIETCALRGCGASFSVPVLTPHQELGCQHLGVKTVTTFMPVWFHSASNKDL